MFFMRINIFVVINQINKHKVEIYNHCTYTKIIIKKIYFFSSRFIRMSGNRVYVDDKKNKNQRLL